MLAFKNYEQDKKSKDNFFCGKSIEINVHQRWLPVLKYKINFEIQILNEDMFIID